MCSCLLECVKGVICIVFDFFWMSIFFEMYILGVICSYAMSRMILVLNPAGFQTLPGFIFLYIYIKCKFSGRA